MKFFCSCLNVKLHLRDNCLKSVDKNTIDIDESCDGCEFFVNDLSLCHLDIEGVQEEHSCLVAHHNVGNWIVAQCIICEVYTHAVNKSKGGNEVLVNARLEGGVTYLNKLENSDDYSELYKVVIRKQNDYHELPLIKENYEVAHVGLTKLQQQLNIYLVMEEASMEKRIVEFTKSEHVKFAALQKKVQREKNALIRLILASSHAEVESSSSVDECSPSPLSPPIEDQQVPINKFSELKIIHENQPDYETFEMSGSPAENEDMFMVDPFDDDSTMHFTESDDDDEDDDDSDDEESSHGSSSSKDVPTRSVYSTSLPMNVPARPDGWKPRSKRSQVVNVEEDDMMPNDMAASIKALAQSICEDGTEVFGDLPTNKTTRVKYQAE